MKVIENLINLTKDRVHGNKPYGAVKGIIS